MLENTKLQYIIFLVLPQNDISQADNRSITRQIINVLKVV